MAREGIRSLAEKAGRLARRVSSMRKDAEEKLEVALVSVSTVGTAGGLAVLRGYLNDPASEEDPLALGGVPMDLVGGIAAHGMAAFGAFGKYAAVGHGIGNGALSSWAVVKGLELGRDMAENKGSTTGRARTRGDLPRPSVVRPMVPTSAPSGASV